MSKQERGRRGSKSSRTKTTADLLPPHSFSSKFPVSTPSPLPFDSPPHPARRSRWPRPCSGPCPRCARSRRRAAAPSRSVSSARGAAFEPALELKIWWQGKPREPRRAREGSLPALLPPFFFSIALPPLAPRRWCSEPSPGPFPPTASLETLSPASQLEELASEGASERRRSSRLADRGRESKPNLALSLSVSPSLAFSSAFCCQCFSLATRGDPPASRRGSNLGSRPGERGGMPA